MGANRCGFISEVVMTILDNLKAFAKKHETNMQNRAEESRKLNQTRDEAAKSAERVNKLLDEIRDKKNHG